jgi:hypothetical protein
MQDPVFTEVYFSPESVRLCLNIVAEHDGRPCPEATEGTGNGAFGRGPERLE